jgi:hypothetical protein
MPAPAARTSTVIKSTNMRVLLAFLFAALIAPAADPVTAGKYTGKWEGASGAAGDFVLTLARNGDAWKAEVSFTMGTEKVNCNVTSLTVDGARVRVVYTFDLLGMKLESTIEGERSGAKVAGKYRTRSLADNSPVDQGNWEASSSS